MALALDAPPVPPPARRRHGGPGPPSCRCWRWPAPSWLFQLSVAGRYGWHRDELYYVDAGRHLSLGYVDFPPVTPLLSRLATAAFGDSLVGLRSLAALAGAAAVVVVALLARELGGGRRAQVLAAVLAATSPVLLGADALFQTVPFDQLAWAVIALLAVRALARRVPGAVGGPRRRRRGGPRDEVHGGGPARRPGHRAGGDRLRPAPPAHRRAVAGRLRSPCCCWRRTSGGRPATAGPASTSSPGARATSRARRRPCSTSASCS